MMSNTNLNNLGDVDALIVNYKTPELTAQAVYSVLNEPEINRVIVVDNASDDGSAEKLSAEFVTHPVTIISSPKNLGFSAGNNLAAKNSNAKYLFLLNSDAYVKPGCVAKLRETLEQNPRVGQVAPAVYLRDEFTLQEATHGYFPTPLVLIMRKNRVTTKSLTPDWISGVSFLVRRVEFSRLGGFDERFFMYHEDVDLSRRFREAGFTTFRRLDAAIVHLLGQSSNTAEKLKAYSDSKDLFLELAGVSAFGRWFVRTMSAIQNIVLGRTTLVNREGKAN